MLFLISGWFSDLWLWSSAKTPLWTKLKGYTMISDSDVNLILIIVSASSLPPDEDGEAAMEGGGAGQEDTNSSCLGS